LYSSLISLSCFLLCSLSSFASFSSLVVSFCVSFFAFLHVSLFAFLLDLNIVRILATTARGGASFLYPCYVFSSPLLFSSSFLFSLVLLSPSLFASPLHCFFSAFSAFSSACPHSLSSLLWASFFSLILSLCVLSSGYSGLCVSDVRLRSAVCPPLLFLCPAALFSYSSISSSLLLSPSLRFSSLVRFSGAVASSFRLSGSVLLSRSLFSSFLLIWAQTLSLLCCLWFFLLFAFRCFVDILFGLLVVLCLVFFLVLAFLRVSCVFFPFALIVSTRCVFIFFACCPLVLLSSLFNLCAFWFSLSLILVSLVFSLLVVECFVSLISTLLRPCFPCVC